MQQKITLIGSTGLIGSNFLEVINNEDYQSVTAITRSRISNLDEKDLIKQSVHDF
jgi:1-deoxy-D-xylulose 5-phosphate reductoisomerase